MMEPPELKTLVHDNASGAREIAQRSLGLLQRATTASRATEPAALLDDLCDLAVKVVRAKPEMAPVFHTLNSFFQQAETQEATTTELGEFRMGLLTLLQANLDAAPLSLERVATHARPLIASGSVLLTHSRSSTVLEALRGAKRKGALFDLVVPESRPNLEGRTLARELAEDQIPVRLVIDALAATAAQGADRILLGADAVTHDALINKVGSTLVALAAREAGIPVTVLCESSKAWTRKNNPQLGLLTGHHRDPKEVWDAAPYGVEVVNLYFERTPLSLVGQIVDEHGVHTPQQWWEGVRARGYARRFQQAFAGELL